MRPSSLVAALLALAGLACLVTAAAQGQVHVALLLVVPIVYATGALPFVGMLLLVAAVVAWTLGALPRVERAAVAPGTQSGRVERKGGGVVLLGPIPIVWGSSPGIRKWMLVVGAAMLALWIGFALFTRA